MIGHVNDYHLIGIRQLPCEAIPVPSGPKQSMQDDKCIAGARRLKTLMIEIHVSPTEGFASGFS